MNIILNIDCIHFKSKKENEGQKTFHSKDDWEGEQTHFLHQIYLPFIIISKMYIIHRVCSISIQLGQKC